MPIRTQKHWWIFFTTIFLITAVLIAAVSVGISRHMDAFFRNHILAESRAHFQNIAITRIWNAKHGGVYVFRKPGEKLDTNLVIPDVVTEDGRSLTPKGPAFMAQEGLFKFRITSLHPLNPKNRPDDFERRALLAFEEGTPEMIEIISENSRPRARYMAPLYVKKSCLQCHAKQGYAVGEIRGGISVDIDAGNLHQAVSESRDLMYAALIASSSLLLAVLFFSSYRLRQNLDDAQRKIQELAITDELTGAFNRRHLYTVMDAAIHRDARHNRSFSVAMVDLDHFKKVNDTYGHAVGDEVLTMLVKTLNDNLRDSDIIARFGGEEFVVLLPEAEEEEARKTMSRILERIEKTIVLGSGSGKPVTASCGIATRQGDSLMEFGIREKLIDEADRAMYEAKVRGRNRVVHFSEVPSPTD